LGLGRVSGLILGFQNGLGLGVLGRGGFVSGLVSGLGLGLGGATVGAPAPYRSKRSRAFMLK